MTSNEKPEAITGGCLCASVRYTVTFPPDHDFANSTTTCQCEQCRKNTGSLIFRSHRLPKSAVEYTAKSTLATFSATPHCERGFCSRCGSFLFWQRDDRDYTCLTVGGLDGPVLQKYGPLLTVARRHLFCEREVPGVTDHLAGDRFAGDDE
ncbi:Mss4-like protein [Trichoderma chlorosporum]